MPNTERDRRSARRSHAAPTTRLLVCLAALLAWGLALPGPGRAEDAAVYVGAKVCAQCHDEQYASYMKNAKKAHSYNSVAVMSKKLTAAELKQCYECHTTGYGKPGGFENPEKTPDLMNAGCEVCHGPGSRHAKSESAEDIKGKLQSDDCLTCHNAERVAAFGFKPLIYGGGH